MAQIAAEVRRGNAKNPKKVKLKHFLLEFTGGKKVKRKKVKGGFKDEEPPDTRIHASKKFWKALVGLGRKKKGAK